MACFPDASGYAVGSIEGRVSIEYVQDKDSS
jgi:mRNA export factor